MGLLGNLKGAKGDTGLVANYAVSALKSAVNAPDLVFITDSGKEGVWKRDLTDTVSADNVGTVMVDNLGKRWKRQFENNINVTWFGAKGDNSTNNNPFFILAVDYCRINSKNLYIPKGEYVTSIYFPTRQEVISGILDFNNITVFGDGKKSIIKTVSAGGADVLQLNAIKNITFRDLGITGVKTNAADLTNGINGVSITNGGENITIDRVHVFDLPFVDNGVFIDGSKAFTIQRGSTGTSDLSNIRILNCTAAGCKYGYILQTSLFTQIYKGMLVTGCYFDVDYIGIQVDIPIPTSGTNKNSNCSATITNNFIKNAQIGIVLGVANNVVAQNNTFSNLLNTTPVASFDARKISLVMQGSQFCNVQGNVFSYINANCYCSIEGIAGQPNETCIIKNVFNGSCTGKAVRLSYSGTESIKNSVLETLATGNADVKYDVTIFEKAYNNIIVDSYLERGFATYEAKNTSSYTTTKYDVGKTLALNSSTPQTVILSDLVHESTVTFIQYGTGQVTFTAGTLTPINFAGKLKTAGQFAIVKGIVVGTNVFLTGDLLN